MALKNRQVQRYARQILLQEVGGAGQEALLAAGAVALTGGGGADSVGLAYLAAGGSPVRVPASRIVSADEVGFLFDAEDVGKFAGPRLKSALKDFNPDAARDPQSMGLLAELPAQVATPAPWVVIGWGEGGRGGLVYRTASGCALCMLETLRALAPKGPSAASVALGALAALAYQRCVLRLSEPVGGLWLEESGAISPLAVTRCQEHSP